ncbi:type I-F CRISPR-associated protein Csy2 [Photobacterium iliopiscarium]|uniref:type I-F CRISPR-associated protein Csy2 n=1 Tax=Photobacterium iliopiscarium TaxID=56192 RepID=UPI001E5895AB|nr:type I-F CRISPR-associated protein Csy2 [Photobacterium iliopiscarium]MCD9465679.1 type I-F CRISPR-associated protein Csy2 [Photobacterium iliopiscarium]MCD9485622.1 type I-F CRISPR-associated protein Csy2 [Photobacterium iliopiscarium]MCF2242319.1 type I-F CRISPR-associated protein Csy2 [Photobacterium iliopiscarium]
MSLFILKNMHIEGANAIAGFTYGFPAITQFLGFAHALSRKVEPQHGISFDGCAVMCHQHQVHAYRGSDWDDYGFALTRNPLAKDGKTAPIVEEGKMNLCVSLLIECKGFSGGNSDQEQLISDAIKTLALSQRCAGGRITHIEACQFKPIPNEASDCRKFLRPLLPGFILCDRSDYLQQHNESNDQNMIMSWLDFSALRYRYETLTESNNPDVEQGQWKRVNKPQSGYLVPLMIGYKQISEVFAAGEVANVRDKTTPFAFTEAVYSVGEWIGSPSRVESINQILWRYQYSSPYYLCRAQQSIHSIESNEDFDFFY